MVEWLGTLGHCLDPSEHATFERRQSKVVQTSMKFEQRWVDVVQTARVHWVDGRGFESRFGQPATGTLYRQRFFECRERRRMDSIFYMLCPRCSGPTAPIGPMTLPT